MYILSNLCSFSSRCIEIKCKTYYRARLADILYIPGDSRCVSASTCASVDARRIDTMRIVYSQIGWENLAACFANLGIPLEQDALLPRPLASDRVLSIVSENRNPVFVLLENRAKRRRVPIKWGTRTVCELCDAKSIRVSKRAIVTFSRDVSLRPSAVLVTLSGTSADSSFSSM